LSQYRFLNRKHINPKKWDACINASTDFPYPLFWYLDVVTQRNWSALVLRDYEAVFPITWKNSFGIRHVHQPFFCQQLGLFSPESHPQFEITCLKFLQRKYLFSEVNLHYKSIAENSNQLSLRQNFVLPLNSGYEKLQSEYSKNTSRNLVKSNLHHLQIKKFDDVSKFVKMYAENSGAITKGYREKHNSILENLINESIVKGCGEVMAAFSDASNPPVAACFMLFSGNRIINIAPVTPRESRESGGMTFLLDDYIKRFAQTEKILDFEGSSVENIARFYKGFGAKPQPFWQYKHTVWDVLKQPFLFSANHYK